MKRQITPAMWQKSGRVNRFPAILKHFKIGQRDFYGSLPLICSQIQTKLHEKSIRPESMRLKSITGADFTESSNS